MEEKERAVGTVAEPPFLPCSHYILTCTSSINFGRSSNIFGLKMKYRRSEKTRILVVTLPLNILWDCEPFLSEWLDKAMSQVPSCSYLP